MFVPVCHHKNALKLHNILLFGYTQLRIRVPCMRAQWLDVGTHVNMLLAHLYMYVRPQIFDTIDACVITSPVSPPRTR